MRIRTRLLLLILAILVPTFSAATLAVGYVYLEERHAQENSVKEAVRAFALLVDNELEIREGVLHALAASPSLARGDLPEFYRHAKLLAPTPETTIILHDLDGSQLLNTRVALASALPTRRVSNIGELMDQYGADRTLVSDMFKAPLGGRHDFVVQVPVRIEGRIRYYLSMGVNASSLQEMLAQQRFPAEWVTAIVDRTGRIVARSRDPEQSRGRTVSALALRNFAAASEGVFASRNLSGTDVQAFYSTVPESQWRVLVSIPKSELQRVPLHAAAFLAGLMAALLVLAVLLARRFGKRAIGPIEYLGRSAEDLGQGRIVTYAPQQIVEIDAVAHRMAEASRQIRRSQAELEQRVKEAVDATERAQAALMRGQKLEALGRLTGGIAHEFNNLLQTLATALQLAALTSTQPKVQSLIDTCKRTIGRATALTGQLGSFGRIQDAKLLTVTPCEQLHNAVQLIRNVLRQGIELELECAEDAWPVTIDPLQFDLALLNLAINARDAMPGGGRLVLSARNCVLEPTIERSGGAHAGAHGGDHVLVTVTDTGTGMTPEVLARALDPFFTTKEPGKGTGLGLAQAYAFATQSQGSLALSSAPGQGTRVELYLPRSMLPLSPQPGRNPQTETMQASGRILFVEDDELVREAVVRGLEEAGFEVLVAANGERALAMIEAGLEVDAAFSDIVMPGKISGIDLAGILRERRPGLPVVLATGYTDQRATVPGVQVLAKPYEIGQLVELLAGLTRPED
jgi:signal transduction histidine kinase/CheY-like chemotaxis protein